MRIAVRYILRDCAYTFIPNNIFNSCLFTAVDEDFQDADSDSDVEEEFDENYAGGATSSEDD